MARKPVKNLTSWLIPKLRKISLQWPPKSIARERAKVRVQIGTYKTGNPEYRAMYKCAECERQGIDKVWKREESHMDHIKSVVDISGFTNWDDYINALFSDESNYQCLCLDHHQEKTQKENKQRKLNKVLTKKKKKSKV